jgi:hypothetical protein
MWVLFFSVTACAGQLRCVCMLLSTLCDHCLPACVQKNPTVVAKMHVHDLVIRVQ